MKHKLLFTFLLFSFAAHAQIITTVAGDSSMGYNADNILATAAKLYQPTGIAVDAAGNLYIADRNNNRVRKVDTNGIITTIAGTGVLGFSGDNGPATAAQVNYPYSIALDAYGNIYFGDGGNARLRKIDIGGTITTIAGNGTLGYTGDNIPATAAEFNNVCGMAIDVSGNIYVADFDNNRIRKIDTTGIITSIAGTGVCIGITGDGGPATAAELCEPNGVALDAGGNIYIVEYEKSRIRKINASGVITTIAGIGTAGYNGDNINADSAEINRPLGIAVDGGGNVYIGDSYNDRIRKVNTDGIITTIAGTGVNGYSGDNGLATLGKINLPIGVAVSNTGTVYIADFGNNRIRRVGWLENVNTQSTVVQKLKIYPNPSAGAFTVNVTSNLLEQIQIIISNTLGKKVKEYTIASNMPTIIQLDEPAGIYFLSATGTQGTLNRIINVVK